MDLLRAVCALAQQVSKWDRVCDVKLYRLICFINGSLDIRMTGWIGDPPEALKLHLFADADFAGCSKTSRSTSGLHLMLLGPSSCWPLAGQSKKQTAVSHSTPEAELVSADHAVRTVGLPALDLWQYLLYKAGEITIEFHEDNNAAVTVLRSGWSATMRHLERTHGVCLRSLAEHMRRSYFRLMYERSALMAADIYTKAFTGKSEWELASRLINHIRPDDFWPGRGTGRSCMPAEHKGGLSFDYWTSNPWACQASDRGLVQFGDAQHGSGDALNAGRQLSASSCMSTPLASAKCTTTHSSSSFFSGASSASGMAHLVVEYQPKPDCTSLTPPSSACSSRVGEKDHPAVPLGTKFGQGTRKPRWRRKGKKVLGSVT